MLYFEFIEFEAVFGEVFGEAVGVVGGGLGADGDAVESVGGCR
jgi:hypothetical protein